MTYSKKAIPRSLKTAVWLTYVGKKFETKCYVSWCKTLITPFSFETGHNVPESKGGSTSVANLRPICAQCNKSMGNRYTIDEFGRVYASSIAKKDKDKDKDKEKDKQKVKPGFISRISNCLRRGTGPSIHPESFPSIFQNPIYHIERKEEDEHMSDKSITTSQQGSNRPVATVSSKANIKGTADAETCHSTTSSVMQHLPAKI